jgi:DNA polymerase-3 subunit delta'
VPGIIGHQDILRELRVLASSSEPPHALLFAGPEGTGRTLLALEYAKLLNCEAKGQGSGVGSEGQSLFEEPAQHSAFPCGACRPCRLIAEGTHPDVILLGPGDTLCKPRPNESGHERHPQSRDIRICQVRGLIELVARFPFEARHRVILIDPADRLGREAAHTILKTLEEPPGHTVFALISAAPEAIIETIISRCRRIDIRLVSREDIEESLLARGIPPAIAARAAQEAHGRPGRAIAFAAHPDLMEDRGRLLERCARIASARTTERFAYANDLAERWRRDRSLVAAELDAWEAFWEERLRAAADSNDLDGVSGGLDALRAVTRARADLLAQVMARAALELMLLGFPRVTLTEAPEEETAAHA